VTLTNFSSDFSAIPHRLGLDYIAIGAVVSRITRAQQGLIKDRTLVHNHFSPSKDPLHYLHSGCYGLLSEIGIIKGAL
jgi:hypothetical protein